MGCTCGEGSRRCDEHLHALAWQRTVRRLEMRWDVPIILRQCNEGGHQHATREAIIKCNRMQSNATECNQVQPNAIECNRVQSSATECNQVQPSAITWSARRTEATAILTGIQLPSAITCGERDGAPWWALACAQPRLTGIQLPSAITCGERMAPW